MATFPYADFVDLADELIGTVFGERDVTLQRAGDALIDAAKPWLGKDHGSLVTIGPVKGVFLDINQRDRTGLTDVRVNDQKCYVAGKGLDQDIDNDWKIVDGDSVWEVVTVMKKIRPGADVIAYLLQVRI